MGAIGSQTELGGIFALLWDISTIYTKWYGNIPGVQNLNSK